VTNNQYLTIPENMLTDEQHTGSLLLQCRSCIYGLFKVLPT